MACVDLGTILKIFPHIHIYTPNSEIKPFYIPSIWTYIIVLKQSLVIHKATAIVLRYSRKQFIPIISS